MPKLPITYLRQHYAEAQIVIYGRSLGSGVASYLAAHTHPRLLILETPYTSFEQIIADRVPILPIRLLLKYTLRTDAWIDQVHCPIALFMALPIVWCLTHTVSD